MGGIDHAVNSVAQQPVSQSIRAAEAADPYLAHYVCRSANPSSQGCDDLVTTRHEKMGQVAALTGAAKDEGLHVDIQPYSPVVSNLAP